MRVVDKEREARKMNEIGEITEISKWTTED